ncbi:longevity assurance proteins LAG1/LAC1 [Macrolepiota fuliginosa MF-IS2]|uniref:Longevity assurance proteins LAG1/LAC1 n=1 Tax=Macrolepiota fuliginosa MF-IS2 TaxID=1400762 RepID=A0A9P5XL98_9AGAR|nr:longevity assurance proteins LAG1/LAC1 [Macrolepiota fuliginosa MF-IS2]
MFSLLSSDRLPSFLLPFFVLQYPTQAPEHPDSFPNSDYFNVGKLDICFVFTLIAIMAVLRDALRLGVLEPFARWKLTRDLERRRRERGLKKLVSSGNANENGHVSHESGDEKAQLNGNGHALTNGNGYCKTPYTRKELQQMNRSVLRFAEQGWSVVYYSLQWCYGLYVYMSLPTRVLNPVDLWLNYPHIPLAGPFKFYYLTQTAFYLHQILILNAEERRKDHVQMMMHHIITVILMWTSYFTNFTRVGALIMVLMDYCDIFLPLAKMLRYLKGNQLLTDAIFGWFLVSWFVTRHVLFLSVIRSTMFDAPKYISFEMSVEEGRYFTTTAYILFCTLLLALELMQCIWFWMICRVAYRVLTGKGAADERSDDEE